jgi:hypothetical protein
VSSARTDAWRPWVLLLFALGSLAVMLSLEPIRQSTAYHRFADQRSVLGMPNFMDVWSNAAFLLVGLAGVAHLARRTASLRAAWLTFFVGVAIVSAGSAWYHSNPNSGTLVWDRLPITIAFMGFFAAVLGEYVNERLGKALLVPAVLLGFLSVLYWHWSGDLRFYIWVQLVPLLTVPVLIVLFRPRHTHQWLLLIALALYGLAKVLETYDGEIFAWTGQSVSGHTLKHLLAASSCLAVLVMLRIRAASPAPAKTD